ncbi:hypothetical protein Q8A67_001475 [Cirrhinus molitorella]|uniref:Uncharacterized protein n=1 Tax=Cirrhinus molitorella TaxID=172907 RepID=A0AA88Q9V3_9TELE|nr:hypothetical protein Q8A67_001475 [Cirrhinus molitorella]
MESIAEEPLPRSISYPQTIRGAKDKKAYKYSLLKNNPETLMADVSQKEDKNITTNLLLYTTDCNLWHTVICKYYKSYRKLGICNGRQIQLYEENDANKAFLTVNIYHNETIMFQGTEACFSSVQANFTSKKALAEAEKQGANSDAAGDSDAQNSRERLEEMELNPVEQDPQLEQSVSQIRNSVSLQEVELVELRELALSHAISSERLQHLENKLNHLTHDFKTSVEELKQEICKLQQDRETLNKELKTVRQELLLREGEIQSLRQQTESFTYICKQRPSSPITQTTAAHNPSPDLDLDIHLSLHSLLSTTSPHHNSSDPSSRTLSLGTNISTTTEDPEQLQQGTTASEQSSSQVHFHNLTDPSTRNRGVTPQPYKSQTIPT